ncbi:unnamed protein product [Linum trigynum]|uniref:SWIM-type domain-containing protein n=1 Tax=Linum trigynum TaxID=586398 RepID=A0AAV2DXV0_9ROSI
MDEFEEGCEDETDEEIAPQVQIDGELQGEGAARTEQAAESVEAPHAQEERRETSQHSSYRLSLTYAMEGAGLSYPINKRDWLMLYVTYCQMRSIGIDWKKATAELEEIEGNDPLSTPFKDFMDQEPRYFCRSFLSHLPKCDSVESNICETWNGTIVKYRGMRIIDMLEGIRGYMMDRVVIKFNLLSATTDLLCPRIRKKVEKEKEFARLCTSKQTLDLKCEVKMGNSGYIVDLQTKTCTCGYWSLSGLPCCHVVSAITHLRKDVDDYVHVSYHATHAREGYKAQPGRPKKNRRKAAHELEVRPQAHGIGEEVSRRGTVIHCSKCGAEGHNARTCKEPVSNAAPVRQGNIITSRRTRGSTAQPTPQPTTPPTAHNTGKRPRVGHCSKCGSATHNARTCPINQGSGIQHVRLNVGDRRTIAREMRVATAGIGVYVNETTGNTYVRLNGANGRPVGGSQPTVVDVQGSQPPVTQP